MPERFRGLKSLAFSLVELLVVIAIILTLAGILFAAFSKSKSSALETNSLSNMRQLGQAATIYSENNGAWPRSVRYLVDAGICPKEIASSPADYSSVGLGNLAADGIYDGDGPPHTEYKLSYGGFLEWQVSQFMVDQMKEMDGAGWLVDLSKSTFESDPRALLFSSGVYLRARYDTSVALRTHYSTHLKDGEARSPTLLFVDEGERLLE